MNKNFNDFNQVKFSGNLVANPRLTTFNTKSGKQVHEVFFTVLSDDTYNNYTTTTPFQCIAFGSHAQNIANNFSKGELVRGVGKVNAYTTKKVQGTNLRYPVTVTRFNIFKLSAIASKNGSNNQGQQASQPQGNQSSNQQANPQGNQPSNNQGNQTISISDNDLPF